MDEFLEHQDMYTDSASKMLGFTLIVANRLKLAMIGVKLAIIWSCNFLLPRIMAGKVIATFSRPGLSTRRHPEMANEYKDHETRSVLDQEVDAYLRQF